jgi:hypothetical protein
MDCIIEYIKSYHLYRENECLMKYFISEDEIYIELKVIEAILYLSFLLLFSFTVRGLAALTVQTVLNRRDSTAIRGLNGWVSKG